MSVVVILGTGGTIAGTGSDPAQAWRYQAAQLSVGQLVAAVPALAGQALEAVQVAQVDSKDMGWAVWQDLARALAATLAREDVAGVVITHGTDTLEETAYLLHRLLDVDKPVVLTAAMRPATAPDADGPANLRDAVAVVRAAAVQGQAGVAVVMGGRVWAGAQVRKAHSAQIDAFDAGGQAPLGELDGSGQLRAPMVAWPRPGRAGWSVLLTHALPRVLLLTSHADADGWVVNALLAQQLVKADVGERLRGIVVAGTGHGTVHQGLEAALLRAEREGVTVWRSSRTARGGVASREGDHWPAAGTLTAAQARVALILSLLGVGHAG
jgi:L-asparaginase